MSRSASPGNANEAKATPKGRGPYFYAYRSNSRVDRLEARHPGLRALVENLLRRRVRQGEIVRRVRKRFGVRLSTHSLSRYFLTRVQPQEDGEASAYRQARGQARALLEEMKADPSLDAAQIAEIMLANQIVKDRMKLAEADILDLYREQRERKKLELQHQTLLLRQRQALKVLESTRKSKRASHLGPEVIEKIKEIYGLSNTPQTAT